MPLSMNPVEGKYFSKLISIKPSVLIQESKFMSTVWSPIHRYVLEIIFYLGSRFILKSIS